MGTRPIGRYKPRLQSCAFEHPQTHSRRTHLNVQAYRNTQYIQSQGLHGRLAAQSLPHIKVKESVRTEGPRPAFSLSLSLSIYIYIYVCVSPAVVVSCSVPSLSASLSQTTAGNRKADSANKGTKSPHHCQHAISPHSPMCCSLMLFDSTSDPR